MRKELHGNIECSLYEYVKSLSESNKISITKQIENIINEYQYSKNNNDILQSILIRLGKLESSELYIKRLLQQMYADLNLDQVEIRNSINLAKFNKNYIREKNK